MADHEAFSDMIVDYITGKTVPNVGVEEIRQRLERFLVEIKGYRKQDIAVDADIMIDIDGSIYQSQLDLVVAVENRNVMVIKCAAGSLESREREVVSASRIFNAFPVPYAVVSDSQAAVIYDTVSGKKVGTGLDQIPSRGEAEKQINDSTPVKMDDNRLKKEKIIFRSYDSMNVNTQRNV